eukprot:130387_1
MGTNLTEVDLGLGVTAIQIALGEFHTCALLSTNGVKCWGLGQYGQLGYGNDDNIGDGPGGMGTNLTEVDLGLGVTAIQIALGEYPGEMGTNLTEVDLGLDVTAIQIALGEYRTCALLSTNGVKCWGRGDNGRLGYGNTDHIGDGSGEMGTNLTEVDLGLDVTAIQIA